MRWDLGEEGKNDMVYAENAWILAQFYVMVILFKAKVS